MKKGYQIFDFLTIIHFLLYFVLGIFMKNRYDIVLVLSISWEIGEYYMTNNKYIQNFLIRYWPIPKDIWLEKNIQNRIVDIIVNILGYYFGNKI